MTALHVVQRSCKLLGTSRSCNPNFAVEDSCELRLGGRAIWPQRVLVPLPAVCWFVLDTLWESCKMFLPLILISSEVLGRYRSFVSLIANHGLGMLACLPVIQTSLCIDIITYAGVLRVVLHLKFHLLLLVWISKPLLPWDVSSFFNETPLVRSLNVSPRWRGAPLTRIDLLLPERLCYVR